MGDLLETVRSLGVNFDLIERVTIIDGILLNKSPLRVGRPSEGLGEPLDLIVEKLPDGTPYIPGSSLKGTLRSLAERLARSEELPVCEVFTHRNSCHVAAWLLRKAHEHFLTGMYKYSDLIKSVKIQFEEVPLYPKLAELRSFEEAVDLLKSKELPCPVCRLFGNTELASHIIVYDALPENGEPAIGYRTRVAIDRLRRAARSGALFRYEYVEPGCKWRFRLKLYNLGLNGNDSASRLFKSLIEYIKEFGLEVGSMKSVGLGLLELAEARAVVYEVKEFKLVRVEEKRLTR